MVALLILSPAVQEYVGTGSATQLDPFQVEPEVQIAVMVTLLRIVPPELLLRKSSVTDASGLTEGDVALTPLGEEEKALPYWSRLQEW